MSESNTSTALSDIWEGDLFERRIDAEMLTAYIESVAGRPNLREDHKGFTISVDADYGTGKSFFLKRLARHLALNHPVAFVDAWADDLADDPLTAVAATLKKALAPYTAKDNAVRTSFQKVTAKVGTIAKFVGKGLLKKGVALALTETGAEELFKALPTEDQKTASDALSDVAAVVSDGVVDGALQKTPSKLMADRIADFEAGQQAIHELKESLADLVGALEKSDHRAPIVVIIDELDRCRPPYAIKLLEELKHLFDVPGLVFILGLNSAQLTKSIRAAYGQEFDSHSYLRRFIDRKYHLPYPDMRPLITNVVRELKIDTERMEFLPVIDGKIENNPSPFLMISRYMELYGLTARDTFAVSDVIQTSMALTGDDNVFMPALLPLIISQIQGRGEQMPITAKSPLWKFVLYTDDFSGSYDTMGPHDYFDQVNARLDWDSRALSSAANSGDKVADVLAVYHSQNPTGYSSPRKYRELIQAVGRFS